MKILIFNFEYPPLGGGGGIATQEIAHGLSLRHNVHLITTRPSPLLHSLSSAKTATPKSSREVASPSTASGRLQIHHVPVWGRTSLATASLWSMLTYVPSAWWQAWQLCRHLKFDLINAQFVLPSGLPAALLARQKNIPFVLSLIGGDIFDPSKGVSPHRHWLLRWLIRLIAKQAAICTAISHDTRRRAIELHRIKNKIIVTHLGINPRHRSTKTRSDFNLPVSKPLFVSIGRVIPRKRYDLLLNAWTKVPAAHLAIIGSGPLRDDWRQLCRQLGLDQRVSWLGYLNETDKINILDLADGYVSASEHEGFGLVFLEAMESGLPIVSPWEGGQTDFLRQETNAILVPPNNATAITAAINRFITDPSLARAIGANNKKEVKRYYWPKAIKNFEQVLISAVSNTTQQT